MAKLAVLLAVFAIVALSVAEKVKTSEGTDLKTASSFYGYGGYGGYGGYYGGWGGWGWGLPVYGWGGWGWGGPWGYGYGYYR